MKGEDVLTAINEMSDLFWRHAGSFRGAESPLLFLSPVVNVVGVVRVTSMLLAQAKLECRGDKKILGDRTYM